MPIAFGHPARAGAAAASVLSIAAQLERFDGGSGSYTVTNGVAFRPGDLTTAMLTAKKLRVFVSGVEQAVYVEAQLGRHPDGSVKVALIQFIKTFSGALSAEIRLGEVRQTTDISKQTLNAAPDAYLFPTVPAFLCAATPLWKSITPMSNRPTGTFWDQWELRYSSTSPYTSSGSKAFFDQAIADNNWIRIYNGAAYLWACHHYEFFAMTGQGKYLYRAVRIANLILTQFLNVASPAWNENEAYIIPTPEALIHYWMTGTITSRDACYTIMQNAGIVVNVSAAQLADRTYQYNHGRVGWDHLAPLVIGTHLGLSSVPDWESGTAATWAAKALKCVDAFISQQFSDGHNTWPDTNTVYSLPATQQNWQVFLRATSLIMYYKWVNADSRIYQHILDGYNYVNDNWWVILDNLGGTNRGWNIINDLGTIGSDNASLNGFGLEIIAWLYRQSGNASLLTRGDTAFDAIVNDSFWPDTSGYAKQINEKHWGAMTYIAARQGVA